MAWQHQWRGISVNNGGRHQRVIWRMASIAGMAGIVWRSKAECQRHGIMAAAWRRQYGNEKA